MRSVGMKFMTGTAIRGPHGDGRGHDLKALNSNLECLRLGAPKTRLARATIGSKNANSIAVEHSVKFERANETRTPKSLQPSQAIALNGKARNRSADDLPL